MSTDSRWPEVLVISWCFLMIATWGVYVAAYTYLIPAVALYVVASVWAVATIAGIIALYRTES